jgi:hypothetical protein
MWEKLVTLKSGTHLPNYIVSYTRKLILAVFTDMRTFATQASGYVKCQGDVSGWSQMNRMRM